MRCSLAVSVLNMSTWQHSEKARKDAAQALTEEIHADVKEWVSTVRDALLLLTVPLYVVLFVFT